jgi:hypothetical protein
LRGFRRRGGRFGLRDLLAARLGKGCTGHGGAKQPADHRQCKNQSQKNDLTTPNHDCSLSSSRMAAKGDEKRVENMATWPDRLRQV